MPFALILYGKCHGWEGEKLTRLLVAIRDGEWLSLLGVRHVGAGVVLVIAGPVGGALEVVL